MVEQNANDTNAQMVEQAQGVWNQISHSNMTPEALDKLIPMGTDFFKALLDVVVKESETSTELHREYREMMKSTKDVIVDALSDGVITTSERIKILNVLSTYSHQLSEVEKERIKQSEGTKRTGLRVAGLLGAIVAIVIGKNFD